MFRRMDSGIFCLFKFAALRKSHAGHMFMKWVSVSEIGYINDYELADFVNVVNSDNEIADGGSSVSESSNVSTEMTENERDVLFRVPFLGMQIINDSAVSIARDREMVGRGSISGSAE
jgi:hypothetical protein